MSRAAKNLDPSLEEIEDCLAKNLGVDNICVRWLLRQLAASEAREKGLREELASRDLPIYPLSPEGHPVDEDF